MKKSLSELRRKVMEFVNLTMPSKGDLNDICRVEARKNEYWEKLVDDDWDDEQEEMDEDGQLNGFGEKCYNCGGYGHSS